MTVSTTVNEIVNNAADRIGDVSELVTPIAETASSIGQTMVRETAAYGACHIAMGLIVVAIGIAACIACFWVAKKQGDTCDRSIAIWLGLILLVSLTIVGGLIVRDNLGYWVAPTKCVIWEISGQLR